MNCPTKDDINITGSQINSNTDSNNPQILNDPARDLGSVRDDKFDIATKDNVKDEKTTKTTDFKEKLNLLSSNLKKFLGFVGPGYGKNSFICRFIYRQN